MLIPVRSTAEQKYKSDLAFLWLFDHDLNNKYLWVSCEMPFAVYSMFFIIFCCSIYLNRLCGRTRLSVNNLMNVEEIQGNDSVYLSANNNYRLCSFNLVSGHCYCQNRYKTIFRSHFKQKHSAEGYINLKQLLYCLFVCLRKYENTDLLLIVTS